MRSGKKKINVTADDERRLELSSQAPFIVYAPCHSLLTTRGLDTGPEGVFRV